jgi:hypothetical protein
VVAMMNVPADPARKYVREFCDSIVRGSTPLVLVPRPPPGAPADHCFPLVQAAVAQHGGSMMCGWTIWERPKVFIEAEFHAVWDGPEGVVDLSPLPPGIRHRVFVPDRTRSHDGRRIDNIRRPLSDDPAILELLRAWEARFEILNRGDLAYEDKVSVSYDELYAAEERIIRAEQALAGSNVAPPPGMNRAQRRAWEKENR